MNFTEEELLAIIPELRVFARSRCHIQSDADDFVQKTLLRMLERDHLFRGGRLIAWGITIMKNILIDEGRSRANKTYTDFDEESLPSSNESDPFEINDVNDALNTLSKKCREVLVLFGFGHSYDEISDSLNIEKGTVMSRLSRCRQQLIKVMN